MMQRIEKWYIYNEYNNFLREIDFLYNEYVNKISTLYKTPEEEANDYEKYLEENPSEYSYIENIEDILPEIQDLTFKRYLSIKNIKYRYLCMNIVTLYQMIEQFFKSIIKIRISMSMDKKLKEKYKKTNFYLKDINRFYQEDYNYDFENNNYYKIIDELRLIENVIKHGEGKSANKLKQINPKYFIKIHSSYPYDDTIINDNLNINDNDFEKFYKGISNFINEMPKHFIHEYELEK